MGNCKSSDVRSRVANEPLADGTPVAESTTDAMSDSSSTTSTYTSSTSSSSSSTRSTTPRTEPEPEQLATRAEDVPETHVEPQAEPERVIVVEAAVPETVEDAPSVPRTPPAFQTPEASAVRREYLRIFDEAVDMSVDDMYTVLIAYRQPVPPPATVTVANTTQRLILWDIMLELAEDFRPLWLVIDGFTFEYDARMPVQRGIVVTVGDRRVAVIVTANTISFIDPPNRKLVLAAAKPSLRSPRCVLCSNDRGADHLTCEVDRYREDQLRTICAKHLGSSSTYA